jgi:biopolymer transport protein ExbD
MRIPRPKPEKARIEIIPMIDVIFFLLVFFMIATLSMTINRGLPVQLPHADSSETDVRERVNITVTQDGEIFVNQALVSLQNLGARVTTAVAADPELTVLLNADGEVPHRTVVALMDELRLAGVAHLAIAVIPEERARREQRSP